MGISDWRDRLGRRGSGSTSSSSPRTWQRPTRGDVGNPGADLATQRSFEQNILAPAGGSWSTPGAGLYYASTAPAYRAMGAWESPTAPAAPGGPRYGGGGGGYGGGGGGGAPAMTQAMFDQMLAVLGAQGPALNLNQTDLPNFRPTAANNLPDFRGLAAVNLPDFVGQRLAAFNAQPYQQALGNINTAVTADQAASAAAAQQASQALGANYSNAYANAPVAAAPQAEQTGAALQQTAGGGGDQTAVAAQSDAAAQSDQASFANLLNVLAAADQTAQGSRMNQVALDQATAGRNINAQALGLRGGVNMAQAQAQNQWRQAAAERDYQNSLMGQQWNREEQLTNQQIAQQNNMMGQQWNREELLRNQDIANQNNLMGQQWNREELMRNQDIGNQQRQGNWQQRNEMISNRLAPLMQLLQSTQGSALNTTALQNLIAQWGRAA